MSWKRPQIQPISESKQCPVCAVEFSFLKRRVNCPGCGIYFCASHVKHMLLLPPSYGYREPTVVCTACLREHSAYSYDVHEDVIGPEDAETMMLVHDQMLSRGVFMDLVEEMSSSPTKYRYVLPDLPGHGSRVDESLDLYTAVECVARTIGRVVPEQRCMLVGHGLGGFVALVVAAKYPELVSALVMISCANSLNSISAQASLMLGSAASVVGSHSLWKRVLKRWEPMIGRARIDNLIFRNGLYVEAGVGVRRALKEPHLDFFAQHFADLKQPVFLLNGTIGNNNDAVISYQQYFHKGIDQLLVKKSHDELVFIEQRQFVANALLGFAIDTVKLEYSEEST